MPADGLFWLTTVTIGIVKAAVPTPIMEMVAVKFGTTKILMSGLLIWLVSAVAVSVK